MDETLDRELILRRIRSERAKGTPLVEMMVIIQDMVESQRLASYLAGVPERPNTAILVPPFLHEQSLPGKGGAEMVQEDTLAALQRHLISLRASHHGVEPLSVVIRRERVEAILQRLKAYSERPPEPSDPNADDK